jgi:hypothetical protein
VLLSDSDHPFEALRKEPVVPKYELAILAFGRDMPEGDILILDCSDEGLVTVNTDSRVLGGIFTRDVESAVGAAVIDYCVVPVFIRLGQHAFNTLTEIGLFVVDRSHYTDDCLLI